MALLSTPTLGPTGIDWFSSAQLLDTARLFASDPALPALLDPNEQESRRIQLDSSPHLQVWLLSWPAGTQNGWHDHAEAAGAFQVVVGTLQEQTSNDRDRQSRTFIAGQGRSFGQNHIHHVANVGVHTALSVHVYAPHLNSMTRYDLTPKGLAAKGSSQPGYRL
jgi:predicted metal-dependent enzyme (double-stranded beta helix superfamily)